MNLERENFRDDGTSLSHHGYCAMPGGFCDSFVDMKLVGSFPSQTEKTPPFEPLVCHRDQVDCKPTPLRHLIMLVIPSNPSLPHLYR
jgi:hypothetical protein